MAGLYLCANKLAVVVWLSGAVYPVPVNDIVLVVVKAALNRTLILEVMLRGYIMRCT